MHIVVGRHCQAAQSTYPCPGTVHSDHTTQTNWTLRVKRALALYRWLSVSTHLD